jgi:glycosyltransferase involved in cell wall biosynthesis
MKDPLVSIIIPTYNRAHLIHEALDSVLVQSYSNWECLVVDDGSTDNTEDVLKDYTGKDSRIQFYKRPNDRKKGANACRNYGYEICKGDFVQWFDSDDMMHMEKLKIKVKLALKYNADVIADSHTTNDKIVLEERPELIFFESETFYVDFILGKKSVITNDVMVKKNIIGKLIFDEKLHKAQEYDFFSRLFNQNLKYCFLDQPLTIYRETNGSISKNTSRGNVKQIESLIYLSKKIQKEHQFNRLIVEKAKRQGRKTYKWLIKKNKVKLLIKNFMFFRKSYEMSLLMFVLYFCYNIITKRGFDVMRTKK